jgi:hypothetical protein
MIRMIAVPVSRVSIPGVLIVIGPPMALARRTALLLDLFLGIGTVRIASVSAARKAQRRSPRNHRRGQGGQKSSGL